MSSSAPVRQAGGAISLLLGVLVLGVVLYILLKPGGGAAGNTGASTDRQLLNCEQRVAPLMAQTHGIGEDYRSGYEALPLECRKLVPPPAAPVPDPNSG
jgi:hypothetical protein